MMDMLIRKPCMREQDMTDLLKFDSKQLRAIIAQLKNDKMIKARLRMETGPDGKATRQNYHYINYRAFVNVVKYKLDHMRRKIEMEERDNTSRASFVCSKCKKTYTDLETGQLVDLMTGDLNCLHCGEVVEEDPNVLPKADSRLILAKFNEQIEPLYILLKEVEDIVLPADLLDPDIGDVNGQGVNGQPNNHGMNNTNSFPANPWSSRAGRSQADYDALMMNTSMTVNIQDDSISQVKSEEDSKEDIPLKKEQPSWMTGSTVDFVDDDHSSIGSSRSTFLKHPIKQEPDNDVLSNGMSFTSSKTPSSSTRASFEDVSEASLALAKEIIENLVRCEGLSGSTKSGSLEDALSFLNHDLNNDSRNQNGNNSYQDQGDVTMDSDGEEGMEVDHNGDHIEDHIHPHSSLISSGPRVRVNGKLVLLTDMSESLVEQMTDFEKEDYIKLCQDFYSHLYD